jgi:hypothetical protein
MKRTNSLLQSILPTMMIEQTRKDFWETLQNSIPGGPDWVAVYASIPQSNLNRTTSSDEEKQIAINTGREIMESLKDGYYVRLSWTIFAGLARGNVEDMRKNVDALLQKSVAAHKINELWKFDMAPIGNYLPEKVLNSLGYYIEKNIPKPQDVDFEKNWK